MRPWLPWIYPYAFGGIFFVVSIWLAVKTGALERARYSHRATLAALCAALAAFMTIHALWIAWVTW